MQGQRLGDSSTVTLDDGNAAACASYHVLLRSDHDLARRTYEALVRAQDENRIRIRDRLLCNVLRPRFMTEAEEASIAYVSEVLASLMERVGERLLSSDMLMNRIGTSDEEREIWSIDPGYSGITVTSRLDSFVSDGNVKFVEYNAESPASIGYSDCLSRVFGELPAMQTWGKLPKPTSIRAALLDTLLRAYAEFGGRSTPTIAIIDWADVITRRDFELCSEYFQEHGIPTVICDPRDLEYTGGKLRHGNDRVDLIYRRVLLHELLEKSGEASALLQAYRDGATCVVNSPRSKLLHKKILFAFLSDGSLGVEMSPQEREVVNATVPWTRILEIGETNYEGEQVDLVRLLLAKQDRFVVKPVDDYGGRGVVLGWETLEEEWQRALEAGIGADYIVQERVEIPEEDFPVWRDGQLDTVSLMLDTNPLLFHGKMGGVLTRTSGSALLNVTAGSGSTTPTFILRNEVAEGLSPSPARNGIHV